MTSSLFPIPPDPIHRTDVEVMQRSTVDDLPHIQALWPVFERLVGLRGRKMYGLADTRENTYTVCTPIGPQDDFDDFGLERGTLPGGWYLRGRMSGPPAQLYGRIGPGMAELEAVAAAPDNTRPLVEFYRRHDQIELWVPILQ